MTHTRPVGEIFEHPRHSEKLIVVNLDGCKYCARNFSAACYDEITGDCTRQARTDSRSVAFVPLSKHVEHKLLGDYDAAW